MNRFTDLVNEALDEAKFGPAAKQYTSLEDFVKSLAGKSIGAVSVTGEKVKFTFGRNSSATFDFKKGKGSMMEGKEPKLDPVGKADADIDNDGDVDSSDKYLKKRRSAIGKAMKEAMEARLNEASLGDHMELIAYAKESGGADKGDMMKAAGIMRKGNQQAFDTFLDGLDEYPASIIKSYT
jgi:hypothetical protein